MKDLNHENMLLAVTALCSISSDPVTFLRTRALIPCRPGSSKSRARSDTLSSGWNLKANRMCREALLMMPVMVLPTPTTVFGSLGKEISLPFRLNLV